MQYLTNSADPIAILYGDYARIHADAAILIDDPIDNQTEDRDWSVLYEHKNYMGQTIAAAKYCNKYS